MQTLNDFAAYTVFVVGAIVGPGVAIQRGLRLRVDSALVVPAGLVACAALYWSSLVTNQAWLFPLGLAALVPLALRRRRADSRGVADGPPWRGAVAPAAALVAFLAFTAYPFNRAIPGGGFAVDPVERIDTAFQAGLAWELALGYPPEVPGLSGHALSYHFGQHLVRGAAVRWAGLTPYDLLTRYDVTLCALALVLVLRALVWHLGGRGFALGLAGFLPLLGDASFLPGWAGGADWWTDMLSSNLHLALTFGNSLVSALALVAAALVALERHEAGEGRGWLVLASVLALAVPVFKVFLALQLGAGLALAFVLTRRRALLAPAVPLAVALVVLMTGQGGHTVRLAYDPFAPVRRTAESLGWDAGSGGWLLLCGVAWSLAALGLRAVALTDLVQPWRARRTAALVVSGAVLSGVLPGLFLRVSFEGEGAAYNEAVYFVTGSMALLWVLAALRLGVWAELGRRRLVLALTALLALPTPIHFVLRKATTPAETVPAHLMRVLARLEADSLPGDVVVQPVSPRFPPPPLVFLGRRVPFTRFIPYMAQFATPAEVRRREAHVRDFFATSDPRRAGDVLRELGATHVLLFGPHALGFDPAGVLDEVCRDGNARLYRVRAAEGLRRARGPLDALLARAGRGAV